jgi:hypothetical protein
MTNTAKHCLSQVMLWAIVVVFALYAACVEMPGLPEQPSFEPAGVSASDHPRQDRGE